MIMLTNNVTGTTDDRRCLSPSCSRRREVRGLCRRCYRGFRLAVKSGRTTEAAEIAAGRILPPHTDERENANPYGAQLRPLRGQQVMVFEALGDSRDQRDA